MSPRSSLTTNVLPSRIRTRVATIVSSCRLPTARSPVDFGHADRRREEPLEADEEPGVAVERQGAAERRRPSRSSGRPRPGRRRPCSARMTQSASPSPSGHVDRAVVDRRAASGRCGRRRRCRSARWPASCPAAAPARASGQVVEEVGRRVCHRPASGTPAVVGQLAVHVCRGVYPNCWKDDRGPVSVASPDVHHTPDGVNGESSRPRGGASTTRLVAVPRHVPQVADDRVHVARRPPAARRRSPSRRRPPVPPRSRSARPRTRRTGRVRAKPAERERVALRVRLAVRRRHRR